MRLRHAELAFPAAIAAGSAALYPTLGGLPWESRGFPAALLIGIAALALAILIRDARRRGPDERFFVHPGRFAGALALMAAYLAALPLVGFFTASGALALLMPPLLGYRRWRVLALTVAVFLAAVWLVFVVIFQRPLPREFFLA